MKKIDLKQRLINLLTRDIKVRKDSRGEIIIHTGIFQWKEGDWRDGPDPELDMDPSDV